MPWPAFSAKHFGLRDGRLEATDVLAVLVDVRRQRRQEKQGRDVMLRDHRPRIADPGGQTVHRTASRLRQAAVALAHLVDPLRRGPTGLNAR